MNIQPASPHAGRSAPSRRWILTLNSYWGGQGLAGHPCSPMTLRWVRARFHPGRRRLRALRAKTPGTRLCAAFAPPPKDAALMARTRTAAALPTRVSGDPEAQPFQPAGTLSGFASDAIGLDPLTPTTSASSRTTGKADARRLGARLGVLVRRHERSRSSPISSRSVASNARRWRAN